MTVDWARRIKWKQAWSTRLRCLACLESHDHKQGDVCLLCMTEAEATFDMGAGSQEDWCRMLGFERFVEKPRPSAKPGELEAALAVLRRKGLVPPGGAP